MSESQQQSEPLGHQDVTPEILERATDAANRIGHLLNQFMAERQTHFVPFPLTEATQIIVEEFSRAPVAAPQHDLDLAYADGYNDGFRQGKQSRAVAAPVNDANNTAPAVDVDAEIAHASALSNRGRFEDAFSVLVHALRAGRTVERRS
jgi:hypothetical protein